jgi:hypothetical protein
MVRGVARGAVVVAALCISARAAAADGRTSSLSWVQLPGAEACGGAAAIAEAVEKRLGRAALVSPSQADFSIEGRAERNAEGFRAVLVLRDRAGTPIGTRDLESRVADCSELRENVALAVALMIDPDAVLQTAPAPPPAPPPPPTVLVERVEVPVAVEPPASWQVEPAASLVIGSGFMPSTSVGVIVGTRLRPPRFWPVEIYGGLWGAQSAAAQSGASVRFSSAFGGLGLCPVYARGESLSFELCGAAQVGVVSSAPTGFATSEGGSLPTVHVAVDGHLSLVLARGVSARLGGSLAAALLRSQFVFDDADGSQSLFEAPALAATADLGLAVTLP